MNADFLVEYYPLDSTETAKVVMRDCKDVDDAIKKFRQEYSGELAQRIVATHVTVGL